MKNRLFALMSLVAALAISAPALAQYYYYYVYTYCPWPTRPVYGYYYDWYGYLRSYIAYCVY